MRSASSCLTDLFALSGEPRRQARVLPAACCLLLNAAIEGIGIAHRPRYVAREATAPGSCRRRCRAHAAYRDDRYLSSRLRMFAQEHARDFENDTDAFRRNRDGD